MTLNKAYGHAMAFTANVIFGLAVPVTQLLLLHWMTPVGYTFSRVVFASAVFWTVGLFGCKEHVKLRDLLLIAVGGFFGFIRHYKIFCVNGKYGIQVRVSYFLFYTFAK